MSVYEAFQNVTVNWALRETIPLWTLGTLELNGVFLTATAMELWSLC